MIAQRIVAESRRRFPIDPVGQALLALIPVANTTNGTFTTDAIPRSFADRLDSHHLARRADSR